jgi:hypothetical protein
LVRLADAPERWPRSPEAASFPYEIRDLYFGVGARPTHRAVFCVRDQLILVVAVRHLAQDTLSPDDA